MQAGGGGGGAAGNRERCCRHCYDQHSAVVERHPQEQDANAPDAPFGALPQPGDRAAAGEGGGKRGVMLTTLCEDPQRYMRSHRAGGAGSESERGKVGYAIPVII